MNKILLKEIFDTDFDPNFKMSDLTAFKIRRASRGVVVDDDGKIAMLNVGKYNYFKFPGGGIEKNESIEEAFKREILEEAGCNTKIVDYGGIVVEWRDQFKLFQINYFFLAKVIGEVGENKLEPDEIAEEYKLYWLSFENAMKALVDSRPVDYEGKFIIERDKSILEFYKDKLK